MNCGITIESAPAIRVYPVSNTPSGYVSDYLRKILNTNTSFLFDHA